MNQDDSHAEAVWDCAFSPDGSYFATASRDRTVKLWDTRSGIAVTTLRGHGGEVGTCRVSPNGRFVVSAGDDRQVIIWILGGVIVPEDVPVTEGRRDLILSDQVVMQGHDAPVLGCAISPDARLVATASEDQTLKLWEPHTGRELATLRGHDGPVFDCAFSPDGSTIVSASWDSTVKLWSVKTCSSRATLHGHAEGVTSCASSPDGSFVASGSVDGTVVLFDVAAGKLTPFHGHDGPVLGCAFSPDASFVASAGGDATLRLWDVPGGHETAAVALPSGLQCVALHPHFPMAVCGDHAGGVHLVDLLGVDYGALVITAVDADDRPGDPVILCPKCRTLLTENERLLGTTVACPATECGAELHINPFVASSPTPVPPASSADDAEWWKPFLAEPPPRKERWFGRKRG